MFWFWFFVAPALVLAFLGLRGERKRASWVAENLPFLDNGYLPPVTLIVPVKGEEEHLAQNLRSLAELDYPDYELLIVSRSAADLPPGVLPSRAKVILAHGDDPETSEKIQNLEAALHFARRKAEVFAFADSDGQVSKTWLRALVAPLAHPGVGASTGYRWFAPEPPDFWSLLRSVWNAVIAGTLGAGDNAFAWGGAMAIRKQIFQQAEVAACWKSSVSDDFALSAAVHAAGFSIAFAPGAMAVSHDHITAGAFFAWIRRQMVLTRIYQPRLWWPALLAHLFYCGAMGAIVIAILRGGRLSEWLLLALLSPGMLKGANRATLAKAELPACATWFERYGWVHTWWVPLATWAWLAALLSSAFTRTIEWRGYRYTLRSPRSAAVPRGRMGS